MNRLTINMDALLHNVLRVDKLMAQRKSNWSLVTKVLCGHAEVLNELRKLTGITSIGDTRLRNLEAFEELEDNLERWYLRVPHLSAIKDVVRLAEVSLNSEMLVIEELNHAAKQAGKVHRVVIMIELGDLREGILPGSLMKFYEHIFELENIEVIGIGSNLGCLSGALPNIDQLMQLVLYRELLELKFERRLPFVSAGTSATLSLLESQDIPPAVNHWRIGESVFLGTDLVKGGTLNGFRDDVFTLESEIVEIKQKSMQPIGEIGDVAPFEPVENDSEYSPGQRGRRALVAVGELDTNVNGLSPINNNCQIVGASSDITVVHVDDANMDTKVGDTLKFRMNYSALLRLMNDRYVDKAILQTKNDAIRDSIVMMATCATDTTDTKNSQLAGANQ